MSSKIVVSLSGAEIETIVKALEVFAETAGLDEDVRQSLAVRVLTRLSEYV